MNTPGLFLTDEDAFATAATGAVRALTQGLGRMARIAQALAANGRTVDLAGLDDGAGLLCAKALDLPPEGGRAIVADLLALRTEIDALAATLRERAPE